MKRKGQIISGREREEFGVYKGPKEGWWGWILVCWWLSWLHALWGPVRNEL